VVVGAAITVGWGGLVEAEPELVVVAVVALGELVVLAVA
jgi:hypothetical protein